MKMTISAARRKVLYEISSSKSGTELMSAFFFIANSGDLKRMSDVLNVETRAIQLKKNNQKNTKNQS